MSESPREQGKTRPALAWRRAGPADLAALEAFLMAREAEAAGFISRLAHDGRIRLPVISAGGNLVLVAREEGREGIEAALLRTQTGIVFPLLPRRYGGAGGAFAPRIPGRLLDEFVSVASVVGPEADVEAFEASLSLKPLVIIAYELMRLTCSASGSRLPRPKPEGLDLRRAGTADLEALYPLQDAYEHEEVLTAIHRFDPKACRAGLSRALREQTVVMGSLGGVAVAKAATNAHAFSLDQIGGVFVAPPYRRRGYGEAVVLELLGRLACEGKGAALFVKKGNEAARGLYDELGFEALGPFRADYLQG